VKGWGPLTFPQSFSQRSRRGPRMCPRVEASTLRASVIVITPHNKIPFQEGNLEIVNNQILHLP
jgi:hypothetical protein